MLKNLSDAIFNGILHENKMIQTLEMCIMENS